MFLAGGCVLLLTVEEWLSGWAWEEWAGVWGIGLMMGRTRNSSATCRLPREWWSSARGVAGMGLSRLKVSVTEGVGVCGRGLMAGPMLEGNTGMGLYGGGEEGRDGVGGMGLITGLGAAGSTNDPALDGVVTRGSMGL